MHDVGGCITLPCQQLMRPCHGLVFQMSAANGANDRVAENGHPGAGVTRCGAFGAVHLHQHRRRGRKLGEKNFSRRRHAEAFAPPAGGLARSRCQNGQAAHVGLQRGGHGNAAVFALVVFQHGHQRATDRQA